MIMTLAVLAIVALLLLTRGDGGDRDIIVIQQAERSVPAPLAKPDPVPKEEP